MDAVLCGEVPAAFHDEAMVLYYLNHVRFQSLRLIPTVMPTIQPGFDVSGASRDMTELRHVSLSLANTRAATEWQEMIKFGAGKYVPRVGNCDTKNNPHEQKSWGKGRNYQWGEADSDNKGGKACALTWTGVQVFPAVPSLSNFFAVRKSRRDSCTRTCACSVILMRPRHAPVSVTTCLVFHH